MKKLIGTVSAALLFLVTCTPALASDLRIGATANFGTANDFGVGPRIEFGLEEYVPGLRLAADVHRFFDSRVYNDIDKFTVESNSWDGGFHVLYDLATLSIAEGATLYAGAGVLYAKRNYEHLQPSPEGISADELQRRVIKLQELKKKYEGDSGASFALSVGSTFNTGWTVIPFVEARYSIGVIDELSLAAGLLFSTGSGTR